jgi:hypothetical protein
MVIIKYYVYYKRLFQKTYINENNNFKSRIKYLYVKNKRYFIIKKT